MGMRGEQCVRWGSRVWTGLADASRGAGGAGHEGWLVMCSTRVHATYAIGQRTRMLCKAPGAMAGVGTMRGARGVRWGWGVRGGGRRDRCLPAGPLVGMLLHPSTLPSSSSRPSIWSGLGAARSGGGGVGVSVVFGVCVVWVEHGGCAVWVSDVAVRYRPRCPI